MTDVHKVTQATKQLEGYDEKLRHFARQSRQQAQSVFRGAGMGGAVLPLAFHWNDTEVKRLLCSIAKVSVVSVSLPLSTVIPALVGLDSSF